MKTKLQPPDWLDMRATQIFRTLVDELGSHLISTDCSVLADFSQAQADIETLTAAIRFEGDVLYSDKGNAYTNPRATVLMSRRKDLERLRHDLGLTPNNRGAKFKAPSKSKLSSAMEAQE